MSFLGKWLFKLGYTQSDKDDKEKAAAKSKPPSGRNNPSKPTAAQKDEMHRRRLINRERQLDAAHDLAMPVKYTKTKGGTYPTFKKKSTSAGSFRDAFKSARAKAKKAGNADGGTFMWGGRKYNTKQK